MRWRISLLLSSLTVFFRDLRHLIDVLFQVWFYLTPVLYPASYLQNLHPALRGALSLNPAAPIVRCFQQAIYEQRFPDGATFALAAAVAAASLAVGFATFRRLEHQHIHYF